MQAWSAGAGGASEQDSNPALLAAFLRGPFLSLDETGTS